MNRKLHEGNIAEIKDLFDGSFASIRQLSKTFAISTTHIRWLVDYRGRKKKVNQANHKWQANNYEHFRAKQKEYYHKNKLIINTNK